MILEEFAPAKVNLFLHVGAPRPDGYHPIASLMVFADVGDRLTARPGDFGLQVTGPFAGQVPGDGRNLILKACAALFEAYGLQQPAITLVVEKNLPVGAGLGGGSSDAAATLRLLCRALAVPTDPRKLLEIAGELGSDVPACIGSISTLASGRGELLRPAPPLPVLHAVLVHPGPPCGTVEVYRAFDHGRATSDDDMPAFPPNLDGERLIHVLGACRNDLEAAACAVEPAAGRVLAALRASSKTRLARLSGSGSASFALCDDAASAAMLAERLGREEPEWWVRPCRLGAPVVQPPFALRV